METSGRELVDRFGKLMADGDVESLGHLYAPDAKVVRFYEVASGRDQIKRLLAASLEAHGRYNVLSIDQFQHAGDVLMWDATVETRLGPLQTTHVVFLDDKGQIIRHIPVMRGYWGI